MGLFAYLSSHCDAIVISFESVWVPLFQYGQAVVDGAAVVPIWAARLMANTI